MSQIVHSCEIEVNDELLICIPAVAMRQVLKVVLQQRFLYFYKVCSRVREKEIRNVCRAKAHTSELEIQHATLLVVQEQVRYIEPLRNATRPRTGLSFTWLIVSVDERHKPFALIFVNVHRLRVKPAV